MEQHMRSNMDHSYMGQQMHSNMNHSNMEQMHSNMDRSHMDGRMTPDDEHAPCLRTNNGGGHNLSPTDPDSPMSWPFIQKAYVSAVAFFFVFTMSVPSPSLETTY